MKNSEEKFFIGIDLGWKEKKTTGICVLTKNSCQLCKDIFGKDISKVIRPYLKNTEVVVIDAPLTTGRGKGKMRLYEKFLSTKEFRKAKVNPIPPALMLKLTEFAKELVEKLEKKGFVLDINLIETFPTLIKKICSESVFLKDCACQNECQGENQKSALICAKIALLHSEFKTRYLGYKDGFLFLPAFSFWKGEWRQKFYQIWKGRERLKYHRLITNIFVK